ncbi:excisionase [Thermus thermophilus]|uniref:helix-turn-helix domain-containing protein n=1 Tax=Thermus thermophilus TaxID=274 RepID=UPI00090ACEAA|nr:helix-turn-helix domain-containing protein [Thermus thermophilus]BAW00581.1 excisionase [Thermus thermophilus]BDB11300.1 excisionase [Thermus thermophilus]
MGGLLFTSRPSAEAVKAFREKLAPGKVLHLEETSLVLTPELARLFRELLGALLRGEAVRIVPLEAELTTGQAAELLGVSRPYLVRLLEEGKIPHHKVGTHRRVRAKDLLAYLEASRKRGRELLDELIGEAQELGLGY